VNKILKNNDIFLLFNKQYSFPTSADNYSKYLLFFQIKQNIQHSSYQITYPF